MQVVIEFKERIVIWNITAKCRKAVAPVAKAFGMTVEKFLEAKTRGKLPGQGCGRPSWNKMPAMPKGFAVTVGDPVWQKRLEAVAEYGEHSTREEVWRALVGFIECLLDDTIQHPTTGKILCEKDKFDEFRTEIYPNPAACYVARSDARVSVIAGLQQLLSRAFGSRVNTEAGAATLSIARDQVTLTDSRHRLIAFGAEKVIEALGGDECDAVLPRRAVAG